MKKQFKEIPFKNKNSWNSPFDLVQLQNILDAKPKDHNQFDFHRVSFFGILICTHDEGKYNLNFKEYNFKKGSIFTIRKDNIHKFYKNKAKGIMLIFTDNFIINHASKVEASQTFLLFNEMLASPKLKLKEAEFKQMMTLVDLISEEYFHGSDEYSTKIVRNFMQVIISKLLRLKSQSNLVFGNQKYLPMFLQFQELVEKKCYQHKKVNYYAKKMGVTTKTLNNVTQSILQKTAKTLINEIVIIQSKRLIINSQDSLSEIAYQIGFEDPTNFFKYFKKYTGESPSQFKASCQLS